MIPYILRATTAEKVPVVITTSSDPTATAPEFAITAATSGATTSAYVAGEWVTAWNSTTGEIEALTPLIGSGQALDVAPDNDYKLHPRWAVGTETPDTDAIGIIRVT